MLKACYLPAVIALALVMSCAHGKNKGDADAARQTADLFHHRVRWKDYGGASLLIVPEKRAGFDDARRVLHDERDLTISDYQLDELQLLGDGEAARVVSKMSWYRLPSITAHEDTVVTELVYRDRTWMIARQTGGPFDEELAGPYEPPDAGSAPTQANSVR